MKNHITILFVILMLLVVVAALILLPSRKELSKKELSLQEKQEENQKLTRELDTKRKENIELENNDPKLLEKVARDEYGYGYPGETIYRFPEDKDKTKSK